MSVYRSGVNGRAAARAECLLARRAILGDLDVAAGLAAEQAETVRNRRCHAAVSRTRQGLTVRAMTQQNLFGVDLGGESDIAAMSGTVNFHYSLLYILLPGIWLQTPAVAGRAKTIIQWEFF